MKSYIMSAARSDTSRVILETEFVEDYRHSYDRQMTVLVNISLRMALIPGNRNLWQFVEDSLWLRFSAAAN